MADYGEPATEYSVDFGEGDQRTMGVREIAKAYSTGTITGDTYVWTDGFADWKPLSEVPELVEAVNAAPVASKPSPWEARGGARAAARSNRSPTADLFGGIDSAGSEEDVATSAPEHPPMGSTVGSGSSSTGARNESSVLFSLSALTSQASARPSTRPSASSSRDDSGLIDLKALTAAAMKSDTGASAPVAAAVAPMAPIAPLGVAPPLGLPAPLGGGITATTDIGAGAYPQPKSKAPLYIGGGLAIGLTAIAAALLLKPEPPPPPPAPIVVAAPPAPTTPAAADPTPAPAEQEAKPPATGAAEDPPAPSAAPRSPTVARSPSTRRSTGAATKKPAGDAPAAAPAAPKTPAPAKKSGGCGCASGDLQCAMRCAARGG